MGVAARMGRRENSVLLIWSGHGFRHRRRAPTFALRAHCTRLHGSLTGANPFPPPSPNAGVPLLRRHLCPDSFLPIFPRTRMVSPAFPAHLFHVGTTIALGPGSSSQPSHRVRLGLRHHARRPLFRASAWSAGRRSSELLSVCAPDSRKRSAGALFCGCIQWEQALSLQEVLRDIHRHWRVAGPARTVDSREGRTDRCGERGTSDTPSAQSASQGSLWRRFWISITGWVRARGLPWPTMRPSTWTHSSPVRCWEQSWSRSTGASRCAN